MKKLQCILFIPLVFIFIFSSCTMEKRLYRPGFYVSHKKSATVPGKRERTAVKDIVPAAEKQEDTTVKNEKPETDPVSAIGGNKPANENKASTLPAFSEKKQKEGHSFPVLNGLYKTSDSKLKAGSSIQHKNHTASAGGRSGGGSRAGRGLMMILVALLLLGLGAIFGFVIGGAFGLLFWWLFGLAALILIIVGLVMIILGLAGA